MESLSPNSNPFSAAAVSGGRLPYFFTEPNAEEDLLQTLDRRQWIGQIVGPHGSGKTTLTHHLWTHAKARFPSLVQVTIRGPRKIQRRVIGTGSPCLYVVDGVERLSRVDRWLFLRRFSVQGAKLQAQNSFPICELNRSSVDSRPGETSYVKRLSESFAHQLSAMLNAKDKPAINFRPVPKHFSGLEQRDGLLVTGHRILPWLPILFKTSFDEDLLNRLKLELLTASIRTDSHDDDGDVFSGQKWSDFSNALLQRHGSNGREMLMEMYDLYEAKSSEKHLSDSPLLLTKARVKN